MHVSGSIVSTEHNFSGGLDMAEMTVLENLTSLSIPVFKVSERMSCEESPKICLRLHTTGTPPLTLFFETLKNRVSRKPCC